jgi:putative Mg2+ transporter-C (MgtC) family protein
MDNLSDLINLEYFIRITVAVIFGFCIGLERELTNKYAGLRTHILVCLGACVFTLISIYGFPTFAPGDNVNPMQATGVRDTARVAAQIVTGIGFIGAGTVLRNGPIVLGLTTAATLWIAASIGMACGAGMLDIAFAGTCLAVLTLVIVRIFERKVLPNSIKRTRRIRISLICTPSEIDVVQEFLLDKYKNLVELTKKPQASEPESMKLTCVVDVPTQKTIKELYKTFQKQEGIISVSIREFNEI